MSEDEPSVLVITEPQAIRALAHQLRLEVIDELFGSDRSYTATELAVRFGGTPSAMSYHLRALEKWGYLRRSGAVGDGRERRWEAVAETLRVGDGMAAVARLNGTLVDLQLNQLRERIAAASASLEASGAEAVPATVMTSAKLKLSRAQQAEFVRDYHALVERYRKLGEGSAEPQMYLHMAFVPEPAERSGSGPE